MNQIGPAGASGWKTEDIPGGGHSKDQGLWMGKCWAKADTEIECRVEGLSSQQVCRRSWAGKERRDKQWAVKKGKETRTVEEARERRRGWR